MDLDDLMNAATALASRPEDVVLARRAETRSAARSGHPGKCSMRSEIHLSACFCGREVPRLRLTSLLASSGSRAETSTGPLAVPLRHMESASHSRRSLSTSAEEAAPSMSGKAESASFAAGRGAKLEKSILSDILDMRQATHPPPRPDALFATKRTACTGSPPMRKSTCLFASEAASSGSPASKAASTNDSSSCILSLLPSDPAESLSAKPASSFSPRPNAWTSRSLGRVPARDATPSLRPSLAASETGLPLPTAAMQAFPSEQRASRNRPSNPSDPARASAAPGSFDSAHSLMQ